MLQSAGHISAAFKCFGVQKLQDHKVKNRFQALADMENLSEPDIGDNKVKWKILRMVYKKSSEPCWHMQNKTNHLNSITQKMALQISWTKTEVKILNINNKAPVTMEVEELPRQLHILGQDKLAELPATSKASSTKQGMSSSLWKGSPQYSTHTNLRLYLSCVLSTLLYALVCWRMIDSVLNKLSTFYTKSLRRIVGIFWWMTISNKKLLTCCRAWTPF